MELEIINMICIMNVNILKIKEQLFEKAPYRSIVNVIYILYIYVDIKYIFYSNS